MDQRVETEIEFDDLTIQDYFNERLPDKECRLTVLTVLADSIDLAHTIGGDRWMLSFDDTYVRLHVGNYQILEIGRNYLWLAFETAGLTSTLIEQLQKMRNWEYPRFKAKPTSAAVYIDCSELHEILPLIRESYLAFLREAASAQRVHTKVRGAYAADVVTYLRSTLGRDLPDALAPAGIPPIDRSAIEKAFQEFDRAESTTRNWQNWEYAPIHRYAVLWNQKRYPVKEIVRLATGIQDLDTVQARAYLAERGFEIVSLRALDKHVWLFQANPKYYDLADRLRQASVGDEDVWTVTRYGNNMRIGDSVLLWLSGAEAGIYAVGELTGMPTQHTYEPGKAPPWIAEDNIDQPVTVVQVPYRYTQILAQPITRAALQADPTLTQLQVIRQPNATNFRVTTEEWTALQNLLPDRPAPDLTTSAGRTEAFNQFRADPSNDFMIRIRRERAVQIQELLAHAETLSLEQFNRDIWQIEAETLLNGTTLRPPIVDRTDMSLEQLEELKIGLAAGKLELHGNYIWRSASATYHPRSQDEAKKLVDIQRVAEILTDTEQEPIEKARQVDAIPGFGDNTATGLVMVFHPREFALYNQQSQAAFRKLGITFTELASFQNAAQALRSEIGAEDFLELDLFLYRVNQNVSETRQLHVWWVNQGVSYAEEYADNYLWAPLRNSRGARQNHWETMREVAPDDIVVHYSSAGINAVSRVISYPEEQIRPGATDDRQGRYIRTEYWPIQPPIALRDVNTFLGELDISQGPLDRNGGARQGYLWRFSLAGLRIIREASTAAWPEWVDAALAKSRVPQPHPLRSFGGLLLSLREAGLVFPVRLVSQYLLALQTKRFVILTGISGTGKTQLAMAVAAYYGLGNDDTGNREVIAVRPDWTDQRGLLGFYNPLTQSYVTTPFLRFVLDADAETKHAREEERPVRPYFVVLDEMNLARVEYYFADFLSSLESGEALALHDDANLETTVPSTSTQGAVPRRLRIPPNLFFTGTVNIDETTSMFSPKVLDRAFTIEFNHVDLARFGVQVDQTDFISEPLYLAALPDNLLESAPDHAAARDKEWIAFGELEDGVLRHVIEAFHAVLAVEHRHFGYRVAHEIARFVNLASAQAGPTTDTLWAALDLAVVAKILPKLSGTQQELSELLVALFDVALTGKQQLGDAHLNEQRIAERWMVHDGRLVARNDDAEQRSMPRLPHTAAKLWTMLRRLRQQGFTAFIV